MAWYSGSWTKRRQLTVDAGLSASTLTDFPLDVLFTAVGKSLTVRPDANDILFTDSDEVTKLDHQLIKRRVIASAGWTWFIDQRVVQYEGTYKRHYGGGLEYQAANGAAGNVVAWSADLETGRVERFTLAGGFEQDDHDNPACLPLSNGKLVYFYSKHGDASGARFRISTNAESVAAFGAESVVPNTATNTYVVPYRFGTDIFLIFHLDGQGWYYQKTTETDILTNTWGAVVTIFDPGGTTNYQKSCINTTNANRIDFLQTNTHPVLGPNSAYHFYAVYSAGSLSFFNSAGTAITLPATTSTMTLVHDQAVSSCWIHSITTDASGYPCALYTTFPTPSSDHRYWQRRWNGSAWGTEVQVVAAGGGPLYAAETYYTPGACWDGNSADIIYAAVWVSGQPEVQRYETSDGGATWTKTADLTSGTTSGQRNWRPFSPRGYRADGPAVYYCQGTYTSFINFNAQTHCWPPLVTGVTVRLPTFTGAASKTIYCYYGNSAATAQENPAGVWDSNYKRVFRAQEPAGDILSIKDEAGIANATKRNGLHPITDSGALGIASRSIGSGASGNGDHWSLGASSALNPAGWTGLTLEMFVNFGGASASASLISNWDTGGACFWLRTSAGVLQGFVRKTGNTQVNANTVSISSGDRYVALAFDATDVRVQVDGTESSAAATGAALAATNSTQNLLVGTDPITTQPWDGLMYEARISNVRRSADWRNATRRARMLQSTYITWGAEESAPGASIAVGALANSTRLLRSHLIGGITA